MSWPQHKKTKRLPLMSLFRAIFQHQVTDLMEAHRIESKGWQKKRTYSIVEADSIG
jgi:arginine decarboxylase-like protein